MIGGLERRSPQSGASVPQLSRQRLRQIVTEEVQPGVRIMAGRRGVDPCQQRIERCQVEIDTGRAELGRESSSESMSIPQSRRRGARR